MPAVPLPVTGAVGVVLGTAVALTPFDIAAANVVPATNPTSRLSISTLLCASSTSSPLIRRRRRQRPRPHHNRFTAFGTSRSDSSHRIQVLLVASTLKIASMLAKYRLQYDPHMVCGPLAGPRSSKPRHSLRSPNPGRDSASNFGAPVALTFRSFAAGVGLVFNLWRQNSNMRHDCLNASKPYFNLVRLPWVQLPLWFYVAMTTCSY
ncbi:hypothetical protein C8R43DRAFT_1127512 [Mycena crocata]|nr:hypothetical protein C8R43DRAFT_1127512 [Mycena crocata]